MFCHFNSIFSECAFRFHNMENKNFDMFSCIAFFISSFPSQNAQFNSDMIKLFNSCITNWQFFWTPTQRSEIPNIYVIARISVWLWLLFSITLYICIFINVYIYIETRLCTYAVFSNCYLRYIKLHFFLFLLFYDLLDFF